MYNVKALMFYQRNTLKIKKKWIVIGHELKSITDILRLKYGQGKCIIDDFITEMISIYKCI